VVLRADRPGRIVERRILQSVPVVYIKYRRAGVDNLFSPGYAFVPFFTTFSVGGLRGLPGLRSATSFKSTSLII